MLVVQLSFPRFDIVLLIKLLLIAITTMIAAGCSERDLMEHAAQKQNQKTEPISVKTTLFSRVLNSGKLRVATTNSPVTYFIGPDGKRGFEFDLANAFADAYGLKVEIVLKDSVQQTVDAVIAGEADIAAAGITKKIKDHSDYMYGPVYQQVRKEVVCHRDGVQPNTIEQLSDINFVVGHKSHYSDYLVSQRAEYPDLKWIEYEKAVDQLLEMVADKEIDCTVADSNIFETSRRYLPELTAALHLSEPQDVVWVIPQKSDKLYEAIEYWINHFAEDGKLHHIEDQYFGHYTIFDYVNIRVFHRRIQSRLPKYRDLFKKAGKKYGIPWTTLAAQSYQESYWNPKAKSPTGVRGLMMLTLKTARSMGYKSRLIPENSIFGGARYLSKLIDQVSPNVHGQDRLWFALAAYNVGMGHVHDAQTLAYSLGKNPNLWKDVREVLPLLSQRKYYKKTKYGYARGTEPVRYVQRIREFKDILDLQGAAELEEKLKKEVDVVL